MKGVNCVSARVWKTLQKRPHKIVKITDKTGRVYKGLVLTFGGSPISWPYLISVLVPKKGFFAIPEKPEYRPVFHFGPPNEKIVVE